MSMLLALSFRRCCLSMLRFRLRAMVRRMMVPTSGYFTARGSSCNYILTYLYPIRECIIRRCFSLRMAEPIPRYARPLFLEQGQSIILLVLAPFIVAFGPARRLQKLDTRYEVRQVVTTGAKPCAYAGSLVSNHYRDLNRLCGFSGSVQAKLNSGLYSLYAACSAQAALLQ
jgi:hypothetical protein